MNAFTIGESLKDCDLKGLHVGLAMGALAPIDLADGKVPDACRTDWLGKLSRVRVSEDYEHWYKNRWKPSLGFSLQGTVAARTRLLVGAGDASATNVGLRVHHTWGVPCIPGSALKGLLSHWLDVVYGPSTSHDSHHPWNPAHPEPDRAAFRRACPHGRSYGPGEVQRILFGSPDVAEDRRPLREWGGLELRGGTTACRGRIVVHDAVYVPGSADDQPFLADVITVHNASYYQGQAGASDHEKPNPVGFLSLRPGVQLLMAIDLAPGEDEAYNPWVDFAYRLLIDALSDWGIGSKTAAGYGRIEKTEEPRRNSRLLADDTRDQLAAWLTDNLDQLRTMLDGEDGPNKFVSEVARHHGQAIMAAKGEIREARLQAIYSFLSKQMNASVSKRKAIRKILEQQVPA